MDKILDYFGKDLTPLKDKKLFLFDLDGTVYLEHTLFKGVKETLSLISARGGRYAFISNNSSLSVFAYVKKLRAMGINVKKEDFFSSASAAAELLKSRYGSGKIYVQATRACVKELRSAGLSVTEKFDKNVSAILVGYDSELTSDKMRLTCKMLTETNAPYYATNPDWVYPVDFGYVPDCGSMCFGYEKATGKSPVFIGKPNPMMINCVMDKLGYTKDEIVLFGDRLYTDVASGVNAGVDAVLVLTGETSVDDLAKSEIKPAFTLKSVAELAGVLR
ncbi:MAG TPA: haloacid dehalogenase [Clostridiales bacterium]|nr:haloacid dehalogenase [Clostridiales bacterium]